MSFNNLSLRKWKINELNWYIANHIYAWTVPVTLTCIVYVNHIIKPSLGVTSCWFHGKKTNNVTK